MASASVLIVESTGALSRRLGPALVGEWEPAGPPVSPEQMVEQVRERRPTVLLVEVGEAGAELQRGIELVMSELPTPMLLMVRSAAARQTAIGLLAAGALDVLALPETPGADFLEALRRHLLLLSKVKVVRHPRGRRRKSQSRLPGLPPAFPVVAVAASLGGPRALAVLLAGLPRPFLAPLLVCQHITPGFSDDLAHWLAAETGHRVVEAIDGQALVPGDVLVAPAHLHLKVSAQGTVKLDDSPAVGGFKPSCDVLLSSVSQVFGAKAIGVVLTGMGRDGARGLTELRGRGGRTVVQDEKSCVVFGMPREAIALGAAQLVLPLSEIAAQLEAWLA